jgi:hypothetical protein
MWVQIYRRNAHIWAFSYLRARLTGSSPSPTEGPIHVLFCVVDHYEPLWRGADDRLARERVRRWLQDYPPLADRHRDSDGIVPQHTFFYPQEEYRPELLEMLARLCHDGYGEVEVHLHHDGDTGQRLTGKLETFKKQLASHGLLSRNVRDGRLQYGFIHGNWALDNSRRDGRWCGVNDELLVLKKTGCYADFTLPTAPSETQTRKINGIYYAADDPRRPKSHNTGIDVRVHRQPSGDLMIVQGPLTLDWKRRKWWLVPGIEAGEIKGDHPPDEHRADLWLRPGIHVRGNPEWVFVKVFTHGTQERNRAALFGPAMDDVLTYLEHAYNDGQRYRLHYVTARQMYNIIRAAEEGHRGDPHRYRDYLLQPLAGQSIAAK